MSHDLNGIWQCDNGGVYYVYHFQSSVWIAGLSTDGQFHNGLRFCSLFSGTIDADDVIRGRWANVPRGVAADGGYIQFKVNYDAAGNALNFIKSPAGDLGSGIIWSQRSDFSPNVPEIDHIFDRVKKNVPTLLGGRETLRDNLKPCKPFPVAVFGEIDAARLQVNYATTDKDKRSYRHFMCDYVDNADGDLEINLRVNEGLLPKNFWTDDWWGGAGVTSAEAFHARLRRQNYRLHCESIMYAGTGECEDNVELDTPPLLPGWQQRDGDGVLINGVPINGDVVLSKKDDHSCFVDTIHGAPFLFHVPTLARVTGFLALDCGHVDDCDDTNPGDDNQEIHPMFSIDIVNAVEQENLTGAWADQYGLTYYIRHVGSEVWWLSMSPAMDNRRASGFYGRIADHGRQIQGTLVNLPLGTNFQGGQGIFNTPPRSYNVGINPDRLTIELPDGTYLLRLYDRDKGRVEPLDIHRHWPPVEKNPKL